MYGMLVSKSYSSFHNKVMTYNNQSIKSKVSILHDLGLVLVYVT